MVGGGENTVSNPEQWRKWVGRLALGATAVTGALAYWREHRRNSELQASNDKMRYDRVVPDCYTPAGIQELLEENKELRDELVVGNAGLIMLDVRALKYLNDRRGRPHGNELLANTGKRLRSATEDTFRSRPSIVHNDRRQPGAPENDILCRLGEGGDEFVVIVRGVDTSQLEDVTERIRQRFGVERAIQDCSDGISPIIASVASVHASERRHDGSYAMGFSELCEEADERHKPLKAQQYNQMWKMVEEVDPTIPRPMDDRNIIGIFWEICCPGFEDLPY